MSFFSTGDDLLLGMGAKAGSPQPPPLGMGWEPGRVAYNYSYQLWFENGQLLRRWTEAVFRRDPLSSAVIGLAYVAVIAWLQRWMRPRPAMELRAPLLAWNCGHALVSLVAFARMWPEAGFALSHEGLRGSLQWFPPTEAADVTLFWGVVFGWCKVLEFGDTVFLVLRKKPTTLLHTFHHSTTLIVTGYASGIEEYVAFYRWVIITNFFVHWWMYAYFALMTLRVRVRKAVPMLITTLQMAQMVFFLYMLRELWVMVRDGDIRRQNVNFIRIGFVLGSMDLLLFANYFFHAYVRRGGKRGSADPRPKAD